jgi:hypothetical protein
MLPGRTALISISLLSVVLCLSALAYFFLTSRPTLSQNGRSNNHIATGVGRNSSTLTDLTIATHTTTLLEPASGSFSKIMITLPPIPPGDLYGCGIPFIIQLTMPSGISAEVRLQPLPATGAAIRREGHRLATILSNSNATSSMVSYSYTFRPYDHSSHIVIGDIPYWIEIRGLAKDGSYISGLVKKSNTFAFDCWSRTNMEP